ncbi:hypothetical protein KY331_01980 [Candidatus Woesearchaeota archaeon]|nr:hypothetical protein [Candidatus Woesearchaeota archaeon]
MHSKKAQGLPLNVIIIAAIVLIVLVVLVIIFSGRIQLFGTGVKEQASPYTAKNCNIPGTNRKCYDTRQYCIDDGGYIISGRYEDCVEANAECCQL